MEPDFYKLLGVSHSATEAEITKAYRKIALQCHPDKNKTPDAEESFKLLSQAYDVLKDRRKRMEYDKQFAFSRLQKQCPLNTIITTFWPPQITTLWRDGSFVQRRFLYTDCLYYPPYCFTSQVQTSSQVPYTKKVKDPLIEREVFITLENVLSGVVKKVSITKKVLNPDGVSTRIENKVLTLNISPGCEDGTRILFPREGDQSRNTSPADLVFNIRCMPHALFTRDNSDIQYTCRLSLQQASEKKVDIPTLDGDTISVQMREKKKYPHELRFEGRGLPNPKNTQKRGNLIVTIVAPKDIETRTC